MLRGERDPPRIVDIYSETDETKQSGRIQAQNSDRKKGGQWSGNSIPFHDVIVRNENHFVRRTINLVTNEFFFVVNETKNFTNEINFVTYEINDFTNQKYFLNSEFYLSILK